MSTLLNNNKYFHSRNTWMNAVLCAPMVNHVCAVLPIKVRKKMGQRQTDARPLHYAYH